MSSFLAKIVFRDEIEGKLKSLLSFDLHPKSFLYWEYVLIFAFFYQENQETLLHVS